MPLAEVEFKYNSTGAITSTGKYYLHSDHLNTPRLATNQAQALLWSWDSDAFGLGTPNTDVDGDGVSLDIPLRFPGQVFEAYSNLNYNYFRDYDPNTGRYVQSDPIGLDGGLNTYGYVGANPIIYIDEFGLSKTNGKHANKSSPMNVGDLNKNSSPSDVEKAIRDAEAAGKTEHARALKGLLKVIKRLKGVSPAGVIEQILEDICVTNPEEPACRFLYSEPEWCEASAPNVTVPLSTWGSVKRPTVIDLGQY
jgi:RHS repeat-associated protein